LSGFGRTAEPPADQDDSSGTRSRRDMKNFVLASAVAAIAAVALAPDLKGG
jgi:hypothetical protein